MATSAVVPELAMSVDSVIAASAPIKSPPATKPMTANARKPDARGLPGAPEAAPAVLHVSFHERRELTTDRITTGGAETEKMKGGNEVGSLRNIERPGAITNT